MVRSEAQVTVNFQTVFDTYAADVYRFSYLLTGDRDEAKDMTSETFVRAWAKSDRIRTETLKAYLLTIARNIHLESSRKSRQRIAFEDTIPDPAPSPEDLAEQRSELRHVEHVLRTLPEIDRTAFLMRVQQDLAYEEIARVLGLSLAAAKVKIHRVRMKLINDRIALEESSWKSRETSSGTCSPSTPPMK